MQPQTKFFLKELLLILLPIALFIILFILFFKNFNTVLLFMGIAVISLSVFVYTIIKAKKLGVDFNEEKNLGSMLHSTIEIKTSKETVLRLLDSNNNKTKYGGTITPSNDEWIYLKSIAGFRNEVCGFKVEELPNGHTRVEIKSGREKPRRFPFLSETNLWLSSLRHIKYWRNRLENELVSAPTELTFVTD